MLIKKSEAKIINQGEKIIRKYTSSDRKLEINHMILNGRTPEKEGLFLFEKEVHFMIFIIRGRGRVLCGDNSFEVEEGDCLDVPPKTRFAAKGNFEYITAETPAWYLEQSEIVDKNGKVHNL